MKYRLKVFILLFSSLFVIIGLSCTGNNLVLTNNEKYVNLDYKILAEGDVNLTILHINDLHGWLNPRDGYGGVATYMGYFLEEGFDPDVVNSSYLLLSGGDQQTGPATATLSKGEAVIDVMNAMNFTAAAIGNHEFDYGVEWIHNRKNMANFPILSANIYEEGTNNLANFTTPYVIQNHSGVQVGIVGLTTTTTPTSTHPKYAAGYDFTSYESALRKFVPIMVEGGAEVIVVLAHVPPGDLFSLAGNVQDLNISIFLGGHGGGEEVATIGNSIVAAAQHKARGYVRVNLTYNKISQEVVSIEGKHIDNIEGEVIPVASIQTIVDYWDNLINTSEVLTYTSEDIYDHYPGIGIGELVTDGFIHNTSYNFGITNRGGGFRDYFRNGDITLGDVVSVIPFENNLMEFSLTGTELIQLIEDRLGNYVFSGVRFNYTSDPIDIKNIMIKVSGIFVALDETASYTGVMSDYSWYVNHRDQFPDAVDTGIHYRDTVVDYFRTLDDLSNHIDDGRMYYIEDYTSTTTTTTTITTTSSETQETSQISPGFLFVGYVVSTVLLIIFRRSSRSKYSK